MIPGFQPRREQLCPRLAGGLVVCPAKYCRVFPGFNDIYQARCRTCVRQTCHYLRSVAHTNSSSKPNPSGAFTHRALDTRQVFRQPSWAGLLMCFLGEGRMAMASLEVHAPRAHLSCRPGLSFNKRVDTTRRLRFAISGVGVSLDSMIHPTEVRMHGRHTFHIHWSSEGGLGDSARLGIGATTSSVECVHSRRLCVAFTSRNLLVGSLSVCGRHARKWALCEKLSEACHTHGECSMHFAGLA